MSELMQILTGKFDNFIHVIAAIWAIIHVLVIELPKKIFVHMRIQL